jgi:hypothetical protein
MQCMVPGTTENLSKEAIEQVYILKFVKSDVSDKQAYTACNL